MFDPSCEGIDTWLAVCDNAVMSELPEDWRRVVAQLEHARERAEQRADALQSTVNEMARLLARQGDTLEAIQKMLKRRETQAKRLERENRKLRQLLGLDDPEPDAAPVPPTPDGTSDDGDSDSENQGGEEQNASSSDLTRRHEADSTSSPKPKRQGGRQRVPPHVPASDERYSADCCSHCKGRVFKREVLTSTVFSAVASHIRARNIHRERVVCATAGCGKPTTAPMPPMPCPRALYDCSFIAYLVVMKFGLMMPLDRIQSLLASQGIHIATGTMVSLMERAAHLADAVDGEHMKQLKSGSHLCFDGTGLKVLIPGQSTAWDGYLEVYTRDETTVFQFDLTKDAEELKKRLAAVTATLVTDAESRNMAGAPGATFAHCNAHVVRKLKDARRVQPELANDGLALFDALYKREALAKAKGLTGSEKAAWRQGSRGDADALFAWMTQVAEGDLPPSDPVRKAAKYYLRHRDGLTRFLDDPDLPIDNNASEREFQRHAKLRLASLFAGSIEGAHRWATLLGIVRTAQKHDLDVQAYLTWLFERRGTHRDRFGLAASELTPAAYKAAGCPGSLEASLRNVA